MDIRNNVQLIGNIGQTPELKKTTTGKSTTRFSLATKDMFKNKDSEIKNTYWHNIVAWEKVAEYIVKNCEKGSELVVNGRLINRSYEDNKGEKKYITEVVVNDVICNTKKQKNVE